MKNRLLLQHRKIKKFLTKKRKFPITINLNFRSPPNMWELRTQISNLHYSNNELRREIKRLKVIIEIRDMEASLNREGN